MQFACNLVSPLDARLGNPNDPVFVAGVGGWAPPVGFASRNRKGWLHPILPFTSSAPLCPQLPVKFTFQLAPQTQWLVGTSTNFGDDTDRDPDYLFEQIKNPTLATPQNGGLLINTPGFVTGSQAVTVTSRDFGGAGQLRASATFQDSGLMFDADIVDREQAGSPQVLEPSGACGTAFRQRPFASLPVDQDCNGMSDGWENQFSSQAGVHLPRDWDKEPGFAVDSPKGDGFSVHDEYRGFQVVVNGNTVWVSTDPKKFQDLFYYDAGNIIGTSINEIFGRVTAAYLTLHRVETIGANPADPGDPTSRMNPLNRNSVMTGEAYALKFIDVTLDPSILGMAGSANGDPDGFVNGGIPIRLDISKISRTARAISGPGGTMPEGTLLAQVIAHEVGHKLGLPHTTRSAGVVPFDSNNLGSLTFNTFMQATRPSTRFYTRNLVYDFNGLRNSELIFQYSLPGYSVISRTPVGVLASPSSTIKTDGRSSVKPFPTVTRITILNVDGTLMNHTPKLSQTSTTDWDFDPASKKKFCLLSGGCQ